MLQLEKCMHFVLRVGLEMCFIANTWGTVLTALLTVLIHLTSLAKAQSAPLVFIASAFRQIHTDTLLRIYLGRTDLHIQCILNERVFI